MMILSGLSTVLGPQTSIGQLSINPATGCSDCTPAELLSKRNAIQAALVNGSRLGIPASFSQEALHSGTKGGTVFPELVTQGSTWDPALVGDIAAAVREAFPHPASPVHELGLGWGPPPSGRAAQQFEGCVRACAPVRAGR
eukprot:COSAG01_NODE_246_length_20450_cov_195.166822_30_plen_141_part_00